MRIKQCRICDTPLTFLLSLGKMPIVNYFPSRLDLAKSEEKYLLNLCLCINCSLVQLNEMIAPAKLFSTYHYMSSTSAPLKRHLFKLADICVKKFRLQKESKIIDIGCNDGVLLSRFQDYRMHTLGVDPAKNVVKNAQKLGIEAIPTFFNKRTAGKIHKKYGSFDLVLSTNTMAQVIDLFDFIEAVRLILAQDGVFVVEVGYIVDMIFKKTFDSIYHEHFSYFSLQSLNTLFRSHGLGIKDVQKISNHGGSLRVFVTHKGNRKMRVSKRLSKLMDEEKRFGLDTLDFYKSFVTYVKAYRKKLRALLISLKKKKKRIVGVGAPAKGVVLLNFCTITNTILDYVTDSTPFKQFRYIPGMKIPVLPEEKLQSDSPPDYFLLLAWTYRNEIIKKLHPYRKRGSKIIIPLPKLEII